MKGSLIRRLTTGVVAVALVAAMVPLAGVGTAGACEDEQRFKLPVTIKAYDVPGDGRYIDGIATNDTSVSVVPEKVRISFVESPSTYTEAWICGNPLAPGQWMSFHVDWPRGISAAWTPVVECDAYQTTRSTLRLTVNSVTSATPECDEERAWTVSVTNPNDFPVADIDVVGVEKEGATFVDTLEGCEPGSIGPHETAEITVKGYSEWANPVTTDVYVTALEQPTVTISADTLAPVYGSPVTFTLKMTHADGTPVTGGRHLKLLASAGPDAEGCDNWHIVRYEWTDNGTVVLKAWPGRPLYYKAAYWDGNDFSCAESDALKVVPRVAAAVPSVPAAVHVRKPFKVAGRLNAGDKSAGKPVKIIAERKRGSRWVKSVTVTTKANSTGNYAKNIKLSRTGTYRVRAYRAGVGYTKYRTVRARY